MTVQMSRFVRKSLPLENVGITTYACRRRVQGEEARNTWNGVRRATHPEPPPRSPADLAHSAHHACLSRHDGSAGPLSF